jgi:hypothetical protein
VRQEAAKLATGGLLLIAAIVAGLIVVLASEGFGTGTASAGSDEETTPTEEETTPEEEESPTEDETTPEEDESPEEGETTPEGEEDEQEDDGEHRDDKGDCPNRQDEEQSEASSTTA